MSANPLLKKIARATDRLAQLKARELLQQQRNRTKAREDARRQDAHRKIELGGLVIAAGLAEWDPAEIVGLLLDGMDRANHSPTARMAAKVRGIQHLQARKS